ncbi:MAG: Holliday junction resolvase Hjc [Candidatus Woesearchaeota archaeon]
MNHKGKGTNAERELLHMFWKNNWACTRCAGSGSMRYDSPDLIAGNHERKLCIECKATRSKIQYFTKEEIFSLRSFSHLFGAEPYIAVKFNGKPWIFKKANMLDETNKYFSIRYESESSDFEELIGK